MKLKSCSVFSALAIAVFGIATGGFLTIARADTGPASFLPPQAAAGCVDLSAYLTSLRALPDSLSMHHQLVDLNVRSMDGSSSPSDLANQHALDLFFHPNLVTLGLAAAKNGGSYLHDFSAYQLDCTKVVTGDIFAAEGMSVIWEISGHSASSVTLKRLTQGGNAEVTGDLSLILRRFQVVGPTAFVVTSAYSFDTHHACASASAPVSTSVKESNLLTVTELFTIDSSSQDPQDVSSDGLKALFARYPRAAAPAGHRGDFVAPVTADHDSGCAAPAVPQPSNH